MPGIFAEQPGLAMLRCLIVNDDRRYLDVPVTETSASFLFSDGSMATPQWRRATLVPSGRRIFGLPVWTEGGRDHVYRVACSADDMAMTVVASAACAPGVLGPNEVRSVALVARLGDAVLLANDAEAAWHYMLSVCGHPSVRVHSVKRLPSTQTGESFALLELEMDVVATVADTWPSPTLVLGHLPSRPARREPVLEPYARPRRALRLGGRL